jgi:two-component system chemotaxis response regulator CheB
LRKGLVVPRLSIRVLIVDDSTFVRTILRSALSDNPDIEVVGFASNGREAMEKIEQLQPDVATIDVDMADRSGLELLDRLGTGSRVGVVMIASLSKSSASLAMEALERGAFDYVIKPRKMGVDGIPRFREMLCEKITAAVRFRKGRVSRSLVADTVDETVAAQIDPGWVMGIGVGSGGPQTLMRLLPAFPAGFPAILIAQHMPPYFSEVLAERLAKVCRMIVREGVQNEPVKPGVILLAPGGMHMQVVGGCEGLAVQLEDGPRVSGHRPSADLLFESLAKACGPKVVGVLMTGAGRDGVTGLARLHEAGAWTVGQDRATSFVHGMAAAAIRSGVVDQVLPVTRIPDAGASLMKGGCRENAAVS